MTMSLPVRAWRVYDSEGKTYTTDPAAIPPDVQVVVYFHDAPYRTLAYGDDQYVVEGVTLYGREMALDRYLEIVDRAFHDHDWPR